MTRRDWDLLFSEYDLRAILENQVKSINDKVLGVPERDFDLKSDEQIAAAIASDLVVEPLEIDEGGIEVDSRDVKVDVSHDFDRAVFDRSQPAYVDGVEVSYHVPFKGDRNLWKCRGSTFTLNPPRAILRDSELVYPYQVPGRDVVMTKSVFTRDLQMLREWMPWINTPVNEYNSSLEQKVRQRVVQRRTELQRTANDLGSLGFKVKSKVATTPPAALEPAPARRKRNRAKVSKEYDVALSFAGEDREYVGQVAEALKALKVEVFYDDFEKVDLWGKELTAHLGEVYGKQSRFVVIFASKYYAAKAWPNHERASALSRQFDGVRDRVLPVRFDNTDIPGIPATVGYIDLRVLTPDKLAELIRQKVDTEEQ